jgi:hypothetical protein
MGFLVKKIGQKIKNFKGKNQVQFFVEHFEGVKKNEKKKFGRKFFKGKNIGKKGFLQQKNIFLKNKKN